MDIEKLTERARGFLQAAQTIAIREFNQRITPEHLLKALLDDEDVDVLAVPYIAEQLARKGLCTGQLTQGSKGWEFYVNEDLTSNTTVTEP